MAKQDTMKQKMLKSPTEKVCNVFQIMTDIKIYNRIKDFIESQFKVYLTPYQEMLLHYYLDTEVQDKLSSLYEDRKDV